MIKFQDIYNQLITESRRTNVIEKYRNRYVDSFGSGGHLSDLGFSSYDDLVSWYEDYLPDGKYLDYALNFSWSGGDPEHIVKLLTDFHKLSNRGYIKNKDIYSPEYKIVKHEMAGVTIDRLIKVIHEASVELKKKEEDKQLKKDREVVYEDDRWKVIVPKTYQASCSYGAGTKWCTSSKESQVHFNSYIKDGGLYYISDKTQQSANVMYKFAIFWPWRFGEIREAQGFDSNDHAINLDHVLPLLPQEMVTSITKHQKETTLLKGPTKRLEDHIDVAITKLKDTNFINTFLDKFTNGVGIPNQVTDLFGKMKGVEEMVYSEIVFYFGDDTVLFELKVLPGNNYLFELTTFKLEQNKKGRGFHQEGEHQQIGPYSVLRLTPWLVSSFKGVNNYTDEQLKPFFIPGNADIIREFSDYLYNIMVRNISKTISHNLWEHGEQKGDVKYWKPINSASTLQLNYPPKSGGLVDTFIKYIIKNPGTTVKEFYADIKPDLDYYSGYNSMSFGSIKDSGIVRTEKGSHGTHKYYLGPNYEAWTQGRLKRFN